MINMTSRSAGFRTAQALVEDEGAWPVDSGNYESSTGRWLRLCEGKMVSIYNHRYAGVRGLTTSVSGQGVPVHSDEFQLQDPSFLPTPRYWFLEADASPDFKFAFGFNDVCNTNNYRSLISAIVPRGAYGNTLPLLTATSDRVHAIPRLQANFACAFADYLARQKIQSRHLSKYIVAQLPVIPPDKYGLRFGDKSAGELVDEAVLELSYTAHDLASFAREMGHVDSKGAVLPPFEWNDERRFRLRAKLDAIYFILYGIWNDRNAAQSRKDIEYIYSTFAKVERDERARYGGRYRSPQLVLLWINALTAGRPDADIAD
jgi:hypothetical protein